MPDGRYIAGIYNYCDRWCERCPFTSRCRLFADEKRLRAEAESSNNDEDNAAFWESLDDAVAQSVALYGDAPFEADDSFQRREDRLEEQTQRDPLVRLSHDYGHQVQAWLTAHEHDFPGDADRFRAQRDCITPAEALEVVAWHHFQIAVKLARATRGLLESQTGDDLDPADDFDAGWDVDDAEDIDLGWDSESGGEFDDGDDAIELAEIHLHDANGSAKVALLGIERSLGAWTILRAAFPAEDAEIQGFQRQLGLLRRLLVTALPDARNFHRPGFDD
jgi:hypothetical protein